MVQVQSKYKNPDKFIEKLKDELKQAQERKRAVEGKYQFAYEKGVTKSMACSSPIRYPRLLPGAELRFVAHVIGVKRTMDGSEFEFQLSYCYLTKEGINA